MVGGYISLSTGSTHFIQSEEQYTDYGLQMHKAWRIIKVITCTSQNSHGPGMRRVWISFDQRAIWLHIEQINALLIPIWFRYLGLGILVHLFGSKKYKKLGRFVIMKGDWCTSFRELKWNLNFSKLHSFFLRLWIQLNANPTFFLFRLPWTPYWRISSNFSNLPTIKLITIPTTWDRLVCCLLLELVTICDSQRWY